MKRVVITGMGPVSAIGVGREAFFDGLKEGRSGIRNITSFAAGSGRQAAEIAGFNVAEYLESQKNYLDHASELAFAAMSLALEDADLDPKTMDGSAAGLLLGSAFGSLATMGLFFGDFVQKGPRLVKPVLFPHTYANTAISLLAIEYNLSGYHAHFASGAVSSAFSLVEGFDLIRQGRAETVFAGGYEGFNELLFSGMDRAGRLSPGGGGAERCAPFDEKRNGFVLGEGAGIVVLEEYEKAMARGALIYGEMAGAGMTGGLRIGDAMRLALEGARFDAGQVDVVLAAANGSRDPDEKEAAAIARETPDASVSSIKPMLGETLGAAGVLQVMAASGLMANRAIPPILNLESLPAGCALNVVRGGVVEKDIKRALVNVVDPGGSVMCLALQRTDA